MTSIEPMEEDFTGTQLAMVAEYVGNVEQGLLATNYTMAHFATRVLLTLHLLGALEYEDTIGACIEICEALGVPVEMDEGVTCE